MINKLIYKMCKTDYTKYERVAFPCPSDKILSLMIIYLVAYNSVHNNDIQYEIHIKCSFNAMESDLICQSTYPKTIQGILSKCV